MLTAVVHLQGSQVVSVHLQGTDTTTTVAGETPVATNPPSGEVAHVPLESVQNPSDPGPIVPEVKELIWGAGSFVVFALLMRFILFPKLKKGMDARYASIRDGHESADRLRTTARAEVADYENQVAAIRAEAAAWSTRPARRWRASGRSASPRSTPGSTSSAPRRWPTRTPPARRHVGRSTLRSAQWPVGPASWPPARRRRRTWSIEWSVR